MLAEICEEELQLEDEVAIAPETQTDMVKFSGTMAFHCCFPNGLKKRNTACSYCSKAWSGLYDSKSSINPSAAELECLKKDNSCLLTLLKSLNWYANFLCYLIMSVCIL